MSSGGNARSVLSDGYPAWFFGGLSVGLYDMMIHMYEETNYSCQRKREKSDEVCQQEEGEKKWW